MSIPLLIKTKRGVEPTREAELLLPSMRAMLSQEERFYQEIDEIRGIRRGTVRIGTFVSTSTSWLPKVLSYFQANYPDIVFEIHEGGQEEMENGVSAGSLDLALMSRPDKGSLEFIPLVDDPLFVVFSSKHDLSSYDHVPVEKLLDYPMIMTYQSFDRDVRKVFDREDIEPDVKYYFKDDAAVLSMVQQGIGIAVLPELITERFPGEYQVRMLEPEAYRTLGIGLRAIKEAGPLSRLVIEYIKENIR